MKHGIITEINWKYIAAVLANEGDDVQSDFFKSFVAECKTWGTSYEVQTQLASINAKLTKDEKELLGMITYQSDSEV